MITPKTKQYILIGEVNFPARTENQIKEAYEKIKSKYGLTLNMKFMMEELGL